MAAVGVVFMWHWLQGSGGEAVATILRRECTNAHGRPSGRASIELPERCRFVAGHRQPAAKDFT
jgi:hypothetical protein